MKEVKFFTVFFALSLLALTPLASAEIPHLISLQGRLTDASDNPVTSSTNFAFRIYDVPTGGSPLWIEFQTLAPNSLGTFSALLGSVATLNIPFNASYWLEVQVNSEVLSPRTRMGSAGYALRSENPWNATGNDIYATNAGNVGIGTSSPAQKLTVAGDVNWTGTLTGGNVPWARLINIPNYAGSTSPGGPATTAAALASNGANCGAGQYAQGVDASGNAEGCSTPSGGLTRRTLPDPSTNQWTNEQNVDDENTATYAYSPGLVNSNAYIVYDVGSTKLVLLGVLGETHSHSFSGCWAGSSFTVQTSTDNTNWYTLGSLSTNSPAPGGAGNRDDYSSGTISGITYMRYIRLSAGGSAGGSGSCPVNSYGDAKAYEISMFY